MPFLHEAPTEQNNAYYEEELEHRAEEEEAAYQRAQELERAEAFQREEDARAQADAEERDRIYRQARDDAAREAEFERRKAEAALEQRMQSVAAMQRKLAEKADNLKTNAEAVQHDLGASLDERFAELTRELNERLENTTMLAKAEHADITHDRETSAELTDFFSKEIKELRDMTREAVASLSDKIDDITVDIEGTAELSQQLTALNALLNERTPAGAAGRIQLADIIQNALPANRYVFSKRLGNGRIADCLISSINNPKAVAIDAHFPVDAYNDYIRAGMSVSEKARNDYRRAVLRHIAELAETLIVPGETENYAVMFAPSEAIFNDLHAHFADVVQDSYRARIWILSPTSLMATLNMMTAIAGDDEQTASFAGPAYEDLSDDIDELNKRLAEIEQQLSRHEKSIITPQAEIKTTTPETPPVELSPDYLSGITPEAEVIIETPAASEDDRPEETAVVTEEENPEDAQAQEKPDETAITRPPFPLR